MLMMVMFVVMIFMVVLMMMLVRMTMTLASAVTMFVFNFFVMMMFDIFHNTTFFPVNTPHRYRGYFRGQKWEILCATQLQTKPHHHLCNPVAYSAGHRFFPRNCLILALFSGLSAKKNRCWSCRSCLLFATCTFLPV